MEIDIFIVDIYYNLLFLLKILWSPGPDLNRHARNERGILSPLCLPISPPGVGESARSYHVTTHTRPRFRVLQYSFVK